MMIAWYIFVLTPPDLRSVDIPNKCKSPMMITSYHHVLSTFSFNSTVHQCPQIAPSRQHDSVHMFVQLFAKYKLPDLNEL